MTTSFMGLIGLGSIEPIPGTAPHPDSWPFATRLIPLEHPNLMKLALRADESLYPLVLDISERLVGQGASSILTTCGYFTPYQKRLNDALPVPVMTSSLMLLPLLENITSGKILVVAADREAINDRCIAATGIQDSDKVVTIGMNCPGPFRDQVLLAGKLDHPEAIQTQVADAVQDALIQHPDVTGVCLECGDMTVATSTVAARTGVPVVDYITTGRLLHAASVSPQD